MPYLSSSTEALVWLARHFVLASTMNYLVANMLCTGQYLLRMLILSL